METKFLLVVFLTASLLSCHAQKTEKKQLVNWSDSLSIVNFINKSSLCQELDLVNDSIDIFIDSKYPYSALLLSSVIKQTKENIYIPISRRFGGVLTYEQQKKEFNEQIIYIKKEFCK